VRNFVKPSSRNFRLMVVGQIVSILGAALLRFALSLYVLDITKSETMFAALFAVSNIPLLLAPLGGAIADRFNRRNLMVIFDFSSCAVIVCFMFLLPALGNSVMLIGAVMVLLSIISALYTPAVTASIPLLVAEHKLAGANGIVQAVQALSGVAAPVLGGVLYGALGILPLIAISCAAFFLSAVMEIFIAIPFERRERAGHIVPVIMRDMKDGFSYVLRQSFILKSMILAALLNLLLTPYLIVGGPIILRVTMQSGESVYGIAMGLINLATIIGAILTGVFAKKMSMAKLHRWMLLIALLALPAALSLTPFMLRRGYYPSFMVFMASVIPIAAIITIVSIFVITKVQKKTPNEHLGKVMAIIMAASQCVAPLGQIIYGIFFEQLSGAVYAPTFFVSGAMFFMAVLSRRILRNEEG
jgi:MFS family permease